MISPIENFTNFKVDILVSRSHVQGTSMLVFIKWYQDDWKTQINVKEKEKHFKNLCTHGRYQKEAS